jgi:hypothetical protein
MEAPSIECSGFGMERKDRNYEALLANVLRQDTRCRRDFVRLGLGNRPGRDRQAWKKDHAMRIDGNG